MNSNCLAVRNERGRVMAWTACLSPCQGPEPPRKQRFIAFVAFVSSRRLPTGLRKVRTLSGSCMHFLGFQKRPARNCSLTPIKAFVICKIKSELQSHRHTLHDVSYMCNPKKLNPQEAGVAGLSSGKGSGGHGDGRVMVGQGKETQS